MRHRTNDASVASALIVILTGFMLESERGARSPARTELSACVTADLEVAFLAVVAKQCGC